MNVFRICGIGILCLSVLMCIKNLRESYSLVLRSVIYVLFFGIGITMLAPIVAFLNKTAQSGGFYEYGETVLKALFIVFLVKITSGTAAECGEGGLARSLENVGRIELLLLSLPLIEKILSASKEMLSW
ncbi:MAG: hypothetical protein IKJ91_05130 [Clostridia bacterium]|nr:hypothetical protein [Clostridia bacterium]